MNPSLVSALVPKALGVTAALGFSLFLVDCIDTRSGQGRDDEVEPIPDVTVDVSTEKARVSALHYGMHSSVYDNALHHAELPALIEESGVELLRWPGGGYSDNYHWSSHSMTPWANGSAGYLGPGTDFGGFIRVAESTSSAIMITVNYGSNLMGDGPGEPKEAAAWVAYANGDPDDEREIGLDGAGNDWLTVGYWAGLRASEPEAEDDGRNHLRIARPEPLGIEYWEIGNEVFGNGFHQADMTDGFELDLHVPYDGTQRFGNPLLSGTTYGEGVLAYIDEMKAVDPSIKIGAVLGTPPADETWMNVVILGQGDEEDRVYHWNDDVLAACGEHIDFGIVHWYPNPGGGSQNDVETALARVASLLTYPQRVMPVMVSTLRDSFALHAGDNAENIELVMTEVGPGADIPRGRRNDAGALDRGHAMGIFAADVYLTAAELGFVNVDWLELHNGTFLNEPRDETPHVKGPAFNGIQMARLLAGPGDRLVTTSSNKRSLVVHASIREDGRVGVLLMNTQAPEHAPSLVTVALDGIAVSGRGERYDYLPIIAATAPVNAASGPITGPEPFSDMPSPFSIELAPYGVTLLLFDVQD